MVKNISGGKHSKTQSTKSVSRERRLDELARQPDQSYGQVIKALGSRHFLVRCQQPNTLTYGDIRCSLKGSIKKRLLVENYVLVSFWDCDTTAATKGSIVEIYSIDEVRMLRRFKLWDYKEANVGGAGGAGDDDDIYAVNSFSDNSNSSESDSQDDGKARMVKKKTLTKKRQDERNKKQTLAENPVLIELSGDDDVNTDNI